MPGQLSIYNGCLSLLEQSPLSTPTPSPTTEASRMLNANWQDVLESCLEQGDWDFATTRVALSRLSATPAFGWTYYYELPADKLRIVYISETGAENDPLLRYKEESGKIGTDALTVYLAYITKTAIDAPGRWTNLFARFVSAELAFKCLKLNISAKDKVEMERKAVKKLALGLDGLNDPPAFRAPGSWVRAIRSGSRQLGGEQGSSEPPSFS